MRLSRLGFGGAPIGNLYREVPDADARAALDAAWDAGVRYFDTAPHYGLGLSERRFGDALRERPRGDFVLSTKVGRLLVPNTDGGDRDAEGGFEVPATTRRQWDFSRDGVRRSLEDSLERLGMERVDIVYIHDPDHHERQAFAEAYPALEELRAEGVVGAIGAGMNQTAMLARFARETDVDFLMCAGRYTLLEQGALDDLLPACEGRDVRIVAVGIFNSGLLARERPGADATYDYAAAPAHLIERAERLAEVCERHGATLPAAALAFPLAHPAVASVCVGVRDAAEVERNAALLRAELPGELWAELRHDGLVREDAPTPG
jgi:D-threo-aldose 1-dehydrogenase